jgi:hypothetical protein
MALVTSAAIATALVSAGLGAAAATLSPPAIILQADNALALSAKAATRNSVRCMCRFLSPTNESWRKNARARVNKPLSIFRHKETKAHKDRWLETRPKCIRLERM